MIRNKILPSFSLDLEVSCFFGTDFSVGGSVFGIFYIDQCFMIKQSRKSQNRQ
jgi:hypothetical protein